jgi:PmbA protein
MPDVDRLARAAHDGLAFVQAQPGVIEAEVFVADNRSLLTRLNYTSHIPCNGVEEPKSTETYGIGLQVSFESPDGVLWVSAPSSAISTAGGGPRPRESARRRGEGPRFAPCKPGRPGATRRYHDPALLAIDDAQLVEAGWRSREVSGASSPRRSSAAAANDGLRDSA